MNRKGFTLIELIATIALLGIIVTISFVSIGKVIEQGKENDCKSLVSSIKSAATEYVSDNRYNRNFVNNNVKTSGTTLYVEISGTTLTSGNYLSSPIINPFNKDPIEPGNIRVKVILNKDYTAKESSILAPNVLKECRE